MENTFILLFDKFQFIKNNQLFNNANILSRLFIIFSILTDLIEDKNNGCKPEPTFG